MSRNNGKPPDPDDQPKFDPEAARASMTRMAEIFRDIGEHAEMQRDRCPYKDAKSRCTAKFPCLNQRQPKHPLGALICTLRDGDLNWRSAWQID